MVLSSSTTEKVGIIMGSDSDLPIVEKAINTLKACGIDSDLVSDVGVAAIGRLLAQVDRLRTADVCIVIAGYILIDKFADFIRCIRLYFCCYNYKFYIFLTSHITLYPII